MKTQEPLLKVDRLCQYFKAGTSEIKAVDDISFEINKGEVFGLVGESGCGKTTTGRSVIRLYDITSGSVYFKGQRICAGTLSYRLEVKKAAEKYRRAVKEYKGKPDCAELLSAAEEEYRAVVREQTENIRSAKNDHRNCNRLYAAAQAEKIEREYASLLAEETDEARRADLERKKKKKLAFAKKERVMNGMQMIFQDPIASLNPRMTVREIVAEGLIIRGIRDKKYIDEQVYRVLNLVGLVEEHAGRYPHEFSGGQRQRIGIARAIVLNPELIIADEPISALDVSIQAQVINLLNDLRKRLELTILFIAHDLSVVKYFCDRIGVMYFGKIVELAPADELFARPLHSYTKSLLSAIPLPDPEYEKGRKRIAYNPLAEHDYSKDLPSMREVSSGHFVYCNEAEFARYRDLLNGGKKE